MIRLVDHGVLGTVVSSDLLVRAVHVVLGWTLRNVVEHVLATCSAVAAVVARRSYSRRSGKASPGQPVPVRGTHRSRLDAAREIGPSTPLGLVLRLAHDQSRHVRWELAKSPHIVAFPDVVMRLAHDPSLAVRMALASSPAVAANPAAVERLLWDDASAVRSEVVKNPAIEASTAASERMRDCIGNWSWGSIDKVNRRLYADWHVSEECSRPLVDRLLLYRIPRSPVLHRFAFLLVVLVGTLAKPAVNVWRALASHPDIPPKVAEYLARMADHRIRQNLLENPATPLYVRMALTRRTGAGALPVASGA